jgi:elongin-A
VGDFEYWKIKPVLSRVASPEQLHEIEKASPQIRGEDAELWRAFIARDIPDWKRKNYVPKNPLKWYEVYKRYIKEQKKEIEMDKAKLIEAMQGLKKEKEAHLTEKVKDTTRLPKLPKDRGMMANYGGVPIGGRKKGFAKPSSVLSFTAGSRTKMTSPAALLTRARREAKEMSTRNKLSQPTDQLKSKTQILQAPQGMVNEYRTAAKPAIRIFTPRKKSGSGITNDNRSGGPTLDEREQRLRALTMKHTSEAGNYTLVDSDSDSNHSEPEEDDLFDEPEPNPAPSPKKFPPSTPFRNPAGPVSGSSRPPVQSSKLSSTTASRPASAPLRSNPKPSDLISSVISKSRPSPSQPQPQPQAQALSSPHSKTLRESKPHASAPRPAAAASTARSPSPGSGSNPSSNPNLRTTGRPLPKPTVIMKRKAKVDIFNRRAKR